MDMTVRHMNIFIEVYRSGSITRASEKLFMTQPAVTRAVKELENYYGVRLFERINRRLMVTEAGRQFYNYAIHIADSFDALEKGLRNWDELGVIRVGGSMTLGSMLLPKVIKEFQETHPGIKVRSSVTNGTRLQEALENNELDFALIEGSTSGENLVNEEFYQDSLILLVPPESVILSREKITLAELAEYPLLLREKGSACRNLLDHIFALHNIECTPLMESVSSHAIIQGVHEGIGISFLPENLVRHSVDSGFVCTRAVSDEAFIRKNYIVYHKNKLLTASAVDFIDMCRRLTGI